MTFQSEDFRDDPDHDQQQITDVASWIDANADTDERRRRRLIARRRLFVRGLRIPFAPQEDLEKALDEIIEGADLLREAGLPQPAVHLLADSFSGKSVGARGYVRGRLARGEHAPGTVPVAYATLDGDGTVGSLATDILTALGEKRPGSLSPDKRWTRARQAIRDRRVSLLILDEFQRAGKRPTISPTIAGKLFDILEAGECGIAFLGKKKAMDVFKACPDLRKRLDPPVHIPPLSWINDSEAFCRFAEEFDQKLVDEKIILTKAGLGDPPLAQLLLEACNGRIGEFSRIIETAVVMITRDGVDAITLQDLADAVQEWSIGNGHLTYNPLRQYLGGAAKAAKPDKKKQKHKANFGEHGDDRDQDPADGGEGDDGGSGESGSNDEDFEDDEDDEEDNTDQEDGR